MKKILVALLLFFVGIYLMLTRNFSDVTINKYPDFDSVKKEGVMEKGWIPSLLPASAYDIAETHNLDSNELFGSFYYKESDEKHLLEQLSNAEKEKGVYKKGGFLFRIDTEKNRVKFRNAPGNSVKE